MVVVSIPPTRNSAPITIGETHPTLYIWDSVQFIFEWLMYLSCATVITKYYNVSMNIVTWTGTIALGRVSNQ